MLATISNMLLRAYSVSVGNLQLQLYAFRYILQFLVFLIISGTAMLLAVLAHWCASDIYT